MNRQGGGGWSSRKGGSIDDTNSQGRGWNVEDSEAVIGRNGGGGPGVVVTRTPSYMQPEQEWEREGLLDPAWEKQQKKVSYFI